MGELRRAGGVLLISCYELGQPPLGLASPLGALREAGYEPAALDAAVEALDEARVRAAGLVGISVPMHTALRLGVRIAARVRRANPAAHVCLYGLYATLNAEHLLAAHAVDSVIGGEVEDPLRALADALDAGDAAAAAPVPGVRRRGEPPVPAHVARVRLAVPERAGLPAADRYARLLHGERSVAAGRVEASRGCLHRCRHCPIPPLYDGRFFVVDPGIVLADVAQQVAAGVGHVSFADPDFLNGPGHALRVARALHAAHPELTFDVTAKIEHVVGRGARLLPELAELGCVFIVSAVESLDPRVLAVLDKGHDRADVERALELTARAGIALRPTFVPFTPWETLASYEGLLDFIETHGLVDHVDPVQLSIRLLVPPGSLLAEHAEMLPHRGALDAEGFTWTWTHPDPRMDRLQAAVAAAVEEAARREEDPAATFGRVRALAREAAGLPAPPARPVRPADRARPPRLTESWFC